MRTWAACAHSARGKVQSSKAARNSSSFIDPLELRRPQGGLRMRCFAEAVPSVFLSDSDGSRRFAAITGLPEGGGNSHRFIAGGPAGRVGPSSHSKPVLVHSL